MSDFSTASRQAAKVAFMYLIISGGAILGGDYLTALVPAEFYSASFMLDWEDWFVALLGAGFIYFPAKSGYRSIIQKREARLKRAGQNLKQDLNALAGLIDLPHVRKLSNGGSKETLKITQSRIRTLSSVYELLLEGEDRVPFHKVAEYISTKIFKGLDIHCDELNLPAGQAVTLGLLLNEAVSPFVPDREDEFPVTVAIKSSRNSAVNITFRFVGTTGNSYLIDRVQDRDYHIEAKLIDTFTRKLRGASSWKKTDSHILYQIRFKKRIAG